MRQALAVVGGGFMYTLAGAPRACSGEVGPVRRQTARHVFRRRIASDDRDAGDLPDVAFEDGARPARRARAQQAATRSRSAPSISASIASAPGATTRRWSAAARSGCRRSGCSKGDRVAIMGDACEEWMICDLAAQALGAITYGIYPTASVSEVEYQMRDGGASIFIAEDQEYVDKILPVADRLPALRWIVVIDDSAMFAYAHPKLKALRRGRRRPRRRATRPRARRSTRWRRALDPRDPAFIVYTSGTTGHPKGALISHGKHLAAAYTIVDHYPTLAREAASHRRVPAALPHLRPRRRDHAAADLAASCRISARTSTTCRRPCSRSRRPRCSRCRATCRNSPRRCWSGSGSTSRIKRARLRRRRCGSAATARAGAGRAATASRVRLRHAAARAIVFRRILNKLGLDRARADHLGRRAAAARDRRALADLGRQPGRGLRPDRDGRRLHQRPAGPVRRAGRRRHGRARLGGEARPTAARSWCAAPTTSTATGTSRTRRARSSTRTAGCTPATSARGRTAGCASSTARATSSSPSGGKTISPSLIENLLRASPYVVEAVVFGHERKYLTARDRDRLRHRRRLGAQPRRRLHRLHQPRPARRGGAPDPGRDRQGQSRARPRRADQGLSHPAQGARSRAGRRAGHAHPQGQAQADV